MTSLDVDGFDTIHIAYDPSTGRPSSFQQGSRELRLDYRHPSTAADQWWMGRAEVMDGAGVAEELEASRTAQGYPTVLTHENFLLSTVSSVGLAPDTLGRTTAVTPRARGQYCGDQHLREHIRHHRGYSRRRPRHFLEPTVGPADNLRQPTAGSAWPLLD